MSQGNWQDQSGHFFATHCPGLMSWVPSLPSTEVLLLLLLLLVTIRMLEQGRTKQMLSQPEDWYSNQSMFHQDAGAGIKRRQIL
jgi:hypothetical protein